METLSKTGVSRRGFLKTTAVTAGAMAMINFSSPAFILGSELAMAADADTDLVNFEYGLENAAIEAYKAAAATNLLSKDVLDIALKFVAQHADHQAGWAMELKRLGGTPTPLVIGKYPDLKSQADILAFAKTLEEVAVGSYYGAIGKFKDVNLAKAAAGIMPIEALHVAVFATALNQDPIPSAFVKGASEADINAAATALQIGPVKAPSVPNSGAGGNAKGDDYSGIVTATLAAVSAAALGALALRKGKTSEGSESN